MLAFHQAQDFVAGPPRAREQWSVLDPRCTVLANAVTKLGYDWANPELENRESSA